jgi:hypothetical protein
MEQLLILSFSVSFFLSQLDVCERCVSPSFFPWLVHPQKKNCQSGLLAKRRSVFDVEEMRIYISLDLYIFIGFQVSVRHILNGQRPRFIKK